LSSLAVKDCSGHEFFAVNHAIAVGIGSLKVVEDTPETGAAEFCLAWAKQTIRVFVSVADPLASSSCCHFGTALLSRLEVCFARNFAAC
jgi:hypothetical protein